MTFSPFPPGELLGWILHSNWSLKSRKFSWFNTQVLVEITVVKYQLPSPTALFKRDWGLVGSHVAQVGLELAGSRGGERTPNPSVSTLLCWNYRVAI